MRQFYEQVRVDEIQMRFYAECPNCGKRKYAGKLPLLCRNKEMLPQFRSGKAGKLRQKAYNKSMVAAVQYLARLFDLCRGCGKWVCDDCYDSNSDCGICRECETHKKQESN